MVEKTSIQQRGFNNVKEGGKIVGFQVRYRSSYYRGVWLSLSNGFEVTVDGEVFKGDQIKVTCGGKTYTQQEMTKIANVEWHNYDPAILTVAKPGGLKPGVHTVRIRWGHRTSYFAPGLAAGGLNSIGAGVAPASAHGPNGTATINPATGFPHGTALSDETREIVLVH